MHHPFDDDDSARATASVSRVDRDAAVDVVMARTGRTRGIDDPSVAGDREAEGVGATTTLSVHGSAVQVIPVIEERLEVGKRRRETVATVRLRKVVHHDTATAEVALARETVDVQRVAIGRVVDAPVAIRHEGDLMIVPVVEERLVTTTQLVLVEELHVRTTRHVEPTRQAASVRREEVIVERLDLSSGEWRRIDVGAEPDIPYTHSPPQSQD